MNDDGSPRIKALLLAAGLGTRLKPLTDHVPKCLVPIQGRPLLDYWFEALEETPIRDVLINTHHLRDQVAAYIDRGNQTGRFCIKESFERTLAGSAGTIAANRDWMDDADLCLVIYADNLSDVRLDDLINFHESHDDPISVLLFRAENPQQCGIATLDSESKIIEFVEKPSVPKSDLANAGVYVISADAYREIADLRGFDLARDILPRYVGKMRGARCVEYHRDIGTWNSLKQAQQEFPRNKQQGTTLQLRKAVFLDRDGTVIKHVHHLTDAAQVELLEEAPDAIRRLHSQGYACVIVSNQSVVGRGLLSDSGLKRVNDRMAQLLESFDIKLDGMYCCPIAPSQTDPTVIEHPDRKPGPGLIWRASQELALDVSKSWMIGDSISDVLAGHNAGCRGIVLLSSTKDEQTPDLEGSVVFTVANLAAAADQVLRYDGLAAEIQPSPNT